MNLKNTGINGRNLEILSITNCSSVYPRELQDTVNRTQTESVIAVYCLYLSKAHADTSFFYELQKFANDDKN